VLIPNPKIEHSRDLMGDRYDELK